jgi:hypothetical protein
LVVGAILVLNAASAVARQESDDEEEQIEWNNAFLVNFGAGSAVGEMGLTWLWSGVPHLEIESGAGFGVTGWQLSLMPKAFFGTSHDRFVVGAGVSATLGASSGLPIWLNVDLLGIEHRARNGFVFTAAAGFAKGLGGGDVPPTDCLQSFDCNHESAVPVREDRFWQGRLGFGYSF